MNLSFDGNVSDNWRRFKQSYNVFEAAAGYNEKSDEIRIAIFLNAIGEEGLELFDTFELTDPQKKSYAEVVKAFENLCNPKKVVVYERFLFYSRDQKDGEPFNNFLVDIKKLVKTCEFGDTKDSMMRDRIILGIADKRLQEKMLKEDITFDKAVDLCRATEAAKGHSKVMQRNECIVQEIQSKFSNQRTSYYNTNKKLDSKANKYIDSNSNTSKVSWTI